MRLQAEESVQQGLGRGIFDYLRSSQGWDGSVGLVGEHTQMGDGATGEIVQPRPGPGEPEINNERAIDRTRPG